MPAASRDAYAAKARAAGDTVEVKVVPGAHFEVIEPNTGAFVTVKNEILGLVGVGGSRGGATGAKAPGSR